MSTPSLFPIEVLSSLTHAGQNFIQQFAQTASLSAGKTPQSMTSATTQSAHLADSTVKFADLQQRYLAQMASLWSSSVGGPASVSTRPVDRSDSQDRRFSSEAWRSDPYFDFLRRAYLMNANYALELVESAPVDDKTRARSSSRMISSR